MSIAGRMFTNHDIKRSQAVIAESEASRYSSYDAYNGTASRSRMFTTAHAFAIHPTNPPCHIDGGCSAEAQRITAASPPDEIF